MAKAPPPLMLDIDRGHVIEALQMVLDTLPNNAFRSASVSWSLTEHALTETISLSYGIGQDGAPD